MPPKLAGKQAGEHVPGQAALGVAGDPLAQQLERDDRHCLAQRQPVEVRQRRVVLDGDEPRLGRGSAASTGPSAATGIASARLGLLERRHELLAVAPLDPVAHSGVEAS